MIKPFMQKVSVLLMSGMVLAASFAIAPVTARAADAPDCDNNAIIRCGVKSLQDLQDIYAANEPADVQNIYAHFGIANVRAMDGMMHGRVTKTGEVWVGNKKVATGAVTTGRTKMGADEIQVPNGFAWMRPPSRSFRKQSLEAYVKMNGDRFVFAVIKSCGNPVSAKNRYIVPPKPETPKPEKPQPHTDRPDLSIEKKVRLPGKTDYADALIADPGDELQYQITVKNTGDTDLTNVIVQDSLPDQVSYAEGDVDVAPDGSQGGQLSELVGEGLNLGTIKKGGIRQIDFTVTLDGLADACDENKLVNNAFAKADNVAEKKDSVETEVCQPAPQVKGIQTTKPTVAKELTKSGAVGVLGAFSITSFLGFAAYRLKDFYGSILG